MNREELEIGLALSGGGFRASVFHLGVLGRLAQDNLLENVTFISTVSGGSIVTGLIYTLSDNQWPSSKQFCERILPRARQYFTTINLQRALIWKGVARPLRFLDTKANLMASCFEQYWGMTASLQHIPIHPRWIINATTYETGKNWRFIPQKRMGDYETNYVMNPDFPVSEAVAASAAVPGLIGSLKLDTSQFKWLRYKGNEVEPIAPVSRHLHLWDGGLYENSGTEPLFKIGKGIRDGMNFVIVSDAGQPVGFTHHGWNRFTRFQRLLSISLNQVRSLRARSIMAHFSKHPETGCYFKIGLTARAILQAAECPPNMVQELSKSALSYEQALEVAEFETTIRQLSANEFNVLYSHGWEVANYTLLSKNPQLFNHKPINLN